MANLLGDSSIIGTAALRLFHTQPGGHLIYGTTQHNVTSFYVLNDGTVWALGNIVSEGSVHARGSLSTDNNVHAKRVYASGVRLTSDKNAKENFSKVNTLEILDNLASMPIQYWNYKEESSSERHIGPTAQDFHAAFGLDGDDDKYISCIDLQGVALAAIQGLNEKNERLKAESAQLHANLANLEARLSALESKG
ncbi:hypothetical protein BP422_13215 [Brevibacillus formosus]|uniref:Peptidase S74 domain-containing protein n=1 Tax=Brevibacillus formosus TaxID=54913 RepID=A0A220MH91_9BACL|nr:tail fiber domain-containing protein [Brevibacillus formosus]ASJ54431.1 hypothetical protein BP422_13215 [Brevibacillus formosus]